MEYKLSAFEGPLDLLLHLIEKQKLPIEDIRISEITDQFLNYIEGMPPDMETYSEFLDMAARLLYIKSRALLPRPAPLLDEDDGVDPEQALIMQLREYSEFKRLSEELKQLKTSGRFYKPREESVAGALPARLCGVSVDDLYNAFMDVISRSAKEPKRPTLIEISRESVSVEHMMEHIRSRVTKGGRVAFTALFDSDITRVECIVAFMALLELIHAHEVRATQRRMGEEIYIEA